jgi:hypothetical protein
MGQVYRKGEFEVRHKKQAIKEKRTETEAPLAKVCLPVDVWSNDYK